MRTRIARGLSRRQFVAAAALAPFAPAVARAAAYPDRPIRIVIPYTAGGVAETIMRLLAVSMEKRLGQKLVIEAKPGAAGNIGTQEVSRADPDGYTLLVAATNNFVINQFLFPITFDPMKTLAPVSRIADVPLVMFSNPQVPARTMKDFVAQAKAAPGKYAYGIPSLGTVNHLLMERFKLTTGADLTAVPFKGSPEATLALLKNDIQLFPIGLAAGGANLKEGKLTALAAATDKRLPMAPEIPTMEEAGFPGFTAANWWGMAAPAGTPPEILDMIAAAVDEARKTRIVQDRFYALGMVVTEMSRAQFAASLKTELDFWSDTIKRGKISLK